MGKVLAAGGSRLSQLIHFNSELKNDCFFVMILQRSVGGQDCGKTIVREGKSTGNRQKYKRST